MLKGIRVPVDVTSDGSAVVTEGANVVNQNILLGVTPAGSLHPWNQELTPDEDMIFEIKDINSAGRFAIHVREFFAELEQQGYARLLDGENGIKIRYAEDGGEMDIIINYFNMELGRIEQTTIRR